ncbi:MAG: efflux RND transporter periplasmic adaptor subunit [Hyphomicrobiaceae bacterium]|nr:efflux RND transporter periplasmic adaptor subunit [Hyphomicrobiaceae bacterium]
MCVRLVEARRLAAFVAVLAATGGVLHPLQPVMADDAVFKVVEQDIDDLKQVFATVRSKDRIEARVRTPGTVISLKVDEGDEVTPGQLVATVVDPKIALRVKAVEAQIVGLESRVATARLDYERAEQLRQRGVTPQARVDQLKTALDVAVNELTSARAERQVVEEQATEGRVLAPAAGRVLRVPVTEGSVVLAGESIATIAANEYLLRLELPERHARFLQKGDPVKVGPRGLAQGTGTVGEGRIAQVYPELDSGRVVADAEVKGLGGYFVGERTLVWISAGKRRTFVVPAAFIVARFGLDYVRVQGGKGQPPTDVVVQTGASVPLPSGGTGREILAGVRPGDMLIRPEVAR